MKRFVLILLVPLTLALAQGTNPNYYQPRRIVNMPNAGLLPDRSWKGNLRLGEDGSLLTGFAIGLWGRVQAGVSYGAYGALGRGTPEAYPRPHFTAKVRPLKKKKKYPAVVLGYDDQGLGRWDDSLSRYAVKSPGFFLALSKNWATFGGNLGLHIGANYSLEDEDQSGFNVYIGMDKNLGEIFALSLEYDAGINDNDTGDDVHGMGKGYLNGSLKWSVRPDFEIEFIAADLLVNRENSETFSREVRITFIYPL